MTPNPAVAIPQAVERSYSPQEIAKAHSLSVDTVCRQFENEPGVEVWVRPNRISKRRYRTLRIPESVLKRVLQRISQK
jgi:hypothetical protein